MNKMWMNKMEVTTRHFTCRQKLGSGQPAREPAVTVEAPTKSLTRIRKVTDAADAA